MSVAIFDPAPLVAAVCAALAAAPETEPVLVAIDGRCASGKTTAAGLAARVLSEKTSVCVWHMDDFFLQSGQRTPERLAEPGGNVDRERFAAEVLAPIRAKRPVEFRRFSCAERSLMPAETIAPARLHLIEGAYSCHPALRDAYALRVLFTIGRENQRARILARNGPERLADFETKWIPMENRYLARCRVAECCALHFDADSGQYR